MTDRELLELILKRLDSIETDMSELKTDVSELKTDVSALKTRQQKTEIAIENTVNKCIDVLYESHTLNAERLDKYDIESIKRNSDIAATLAKAAYDMVSKVS